jgi:phenylacetate-CoA ligase
MIRYNIGDIGILSKEPCPCGRTFPILQSIEGRSDDYLVMSDGRLISPFTAMRLIENIPGIERYQIIQENIDEIQVYVETKKNINNIIYLAKSNMKMLVGNQIHIDVILKEIPKYTGKKFRAVISKIDSNRV